MARRSGGRTTGTGALTMGFPGRWALASCAAILTAGALFASNLAPEGRGRLPVRVVDAATGVPLPARLSMRSSDGRYPGDRLDSSAARWPHIEAHAVFLSGQETFALPAGKTAVTAAH